jgi:hypothetical protein
MHARPFLGDLPGELGRRTVSRAGNGQAVLRDYWEYPAFLMHDAYTMHPDEFADRRGFSKAPRFFKDTVWFDRSLSRGKIALGVSGTFVDGSSASETRTSNSECEMHGSGN